MTNPPELILPDGVADMLAPPKFELPRKPPRMVKVLQSLPHPRAVVKSHYSVLPARALSDERLTPALLRTLGVLCLHTSPLGICYPSIFRLALIANRHVRTIHKDLAVLTKLGYVRRLKSKRKGTRHAARRQVIYVPGQPPPPKERLDTYTPPWRYPFDGRQDGAKVSTADDKETPTMIQAMQHDEAISYEAAMKAGRIPPAHVMTPGQTATARRYTLYTNALEAEAWQVADHFAGAMKRAGMNATADFNIGAAVKWLKLGHEKKAAMGWIDAVIADCTGRNKKPPECLGKFPLPGPNGAHAEVSTAPTAKAAT